MIIQINQYNTFNFGNESQTNEQLSEGADSMSASNMSQNKFGSFNSNNIGDVFKSVGNDINKDSSSLNYNQNRPRSKVSEGQKSDDSGKIVPLQVQVVSDCDMMSQNSGNMGYN